MASKIFEGSAPANNGEFLRWISATSQTLHTAGIISFGCIAWNTVFRNPRRAGLGGQRLTLGAGAHEEEAHVRCVAQPFGGIEDVAKRVGHPMGADVADDELAADSPRIGEGLVARARAISGQIDAVHDHGDLLRGNAARHEAVLERTRQRDHRGGVVVEVQLEPFQHLQCKTLAHRAHRGNGGRPQVAELEHERQSPKRAPRRSEKS